MKKSNSLIALAIVLCMLVAVVPFLGHKVLADTEYTITFAVEEGEHEISSEGRDGEVIIDGVYVNLKNSTDNTQAIGDVNVAADGQSATITVTNGTAGCINFGGSDAFSLFIGNSENPFNDFSTTFSTNTTIKVKNYVAPQQGGGQQATIIPLFFQNAQSINGNAINFAVGETDTIVTATVQGAAAGVATWNDDMLEIDRNHLNDVTFTLNNFDEETMGIYLSGSNNWSSQMIVNNNVASFNPETNVPDGNVTMRIGLIEDNQQGGGGEPYVEPTECTVDFGSASYDVKVRTLTKTVTASVEEKNIKNAGGVLIGREERIRLDGFEPNNMEPYMTVKRDGFEFELDVIEENGVYYTYIDLKKAGSIPYEEEMEFAIRRYTADPPEGPQLENPNQFDVPVMITSTNGHEKSYAYGLVTVNGFEAMQMPEPGQEDQMPDIYQRDDFSYYYDEEENPGTVTIGFSTLFIYKYVGTITINNTSYAIPIDYTNRNEWLEAYKQQTVSFEIEVPYADHYDIVCDVDEMPGENQYIANFLWTDDEKAEGTDEYIGPSLLEVVRIEYDIINPDSGEEETIVIEEDEIANAKYIEYSPYGEVGSLVCPDYAWVTARITPDYGYQVTSIGINNQDITTGDAISEFKFQVHRGNFHLGAKTTAVDDVVEAASEKVKGGTIEIANDEIDAGTVVLSVNDVELTTDKIKEFKGAAGDYEISSYLDIDLDQVFYKGTSEDVWANRIHELNNEATITLQLEEGVDGNKIVIVHNINDGDEYEIIEVESYDPETNTITFKTKSFSNYAIASKVDDENPTPTPEKEDKIDTTSKEVKTGDKIILYVVILTIAVLGVLFTVRYNKKNNSCKH